MTWTRAQSGSGSSVEKLAPLATVRATDVDSIAGRKMLNTHRARARVVAASRRPTRVAKTPRPQQVSSSVTASNDERSTAGSSTMPATITVVPPLRERACSGIWLREAGCGSGGNRQAE